MPKSKNSSVLPEFSKAFGHERQKRFFRAVVQNNTLSHAYAFVGPNYVGKTTFAVELARVLGAHPLLDVVLFDHQEPLTIEQARALQAQLALSPAGRYKVGIIADADKMKTPAANSLLKLLEEPPPRAVLILTVNNFYSLLPTVSSRLQKVIFNRLPEETMKQALRSFKLPAKKAEEIMSIAKGRLGLARRLAEDEALLEFYQEALRACRLLQEGTLLARLQKAEELAKLSSGQLEDFFRFALEQWVSDPKPSLVPHKLLSALRELRYNLNKKLILDNLFIPL